MELITDIDEQQLQQLTEMHVGRAAVLFTTPLCGTCKVAEKMLTIAFHVGVPSKLYKANINFMPFFREHWKISSVPALVLLKNGKHADTIYAMNSVDTLVDRLKHF